MFEVEAKLRVPGLEAVRVRLREVGAVLVGAEAQEDLFLRHPCRDLAAGDETLRLRTRSLDSGATVAELTYKGPRLKADQKARVEETLRLDADPKVLLAHLGFTPGPVLRKRREEWRWEEAGVSVALDELAGVGTFVEVEAVAEDRVEAGHRVEAAVAKLALGGERVAEPYVELARRAGLL